MFNKIMIVCVANVCRSPIGEALFKHHLPNKHVASAGVSTQELNLSGVEADALSIEVSNDNGLDLSEHQACQLTTEACDEFDLILVMEPDHIELVADISPGARSKTLLIGQWSGDACIDDPFRQEKPAFVHTYQRLESAAKAWAQRLN